MVKHRSETRNSGNHSEVLRETRDDGVRMFSLDPRQATTWRSLGELKNQLGDLPGALAGYEEALAIDPGEVWALAGRGYARAQLGRPGGLEDCERAIDVNLSWPR